MKKLLLGCAAMLMALSAPLTALATCSGGTFVCGQSCSASCGSPISGGTTFSGQCMQGVGGAGVTACTVANQGNAANLMRCSGGAAICTGGPVGTNCKSDADCGTNQVCVSSTGSSGCGTGFAQCFTSCSG